MRTRCIKCNKIIPKARLKALPGTETCVKCSQVSGNVGIVVWDKTTPSLVVVSPNEAKEYKRLERERM